ncbi:MAG: hypothetical protein QOC93_250 [Actinomycetota bacterium]|jgi:hypothetical protein|nr:hypothetical protein [Actinomycetota bacterium]
MRDLTAAIDELDAFDPASVPSSVLGGRLTELDRALARLHGLRARWLAEFDTADGGTADGAVTTAAWLRQTCRTGDHDARTQVRVAAALRRLPSTAAALAAGEISWAHAVALTSVLAEAAARLDPADAAAVEQTLLRLARVDTVDRLRIAVRHTANALDPDGALARADREFHRRWLTAAVTDDGLVHLQGVLDAEGGAILLAALDAAAGPPTPDDHRTRGQARADALVDLAGRQLDAGTLPTVGGRRPHLTLTASIESLRGGTAELTGTAAGTHAGAAQPGRLLVRGPELGWTGPIPVETARRLACDAFVTRLLLDPDGQPLHLGHTRRLASPAQRLALAHRDGGCVFPRCDRPPEWCDAHHITSWIDGGRTDLEALCLLCRFHHRFVHEYGWIVTRDALGRYTVERPPGAVLPRENRTRPGRLTIGPRSTATPAGTAGARAP